MMQARGIDIVTIGFVFASMPMIFQVGRMFSAIVSDFWGRKLFFVLNGIAGTITNLIYYLANTPLEFLFGKVTEGTKEASLWAVNRAFMLENSEKKWRALVTLRTVAYLSSAFGSLVAGFLIIWLFYEGTLLLCAAIMTLIVPLSLFLASRRREKLNIKKALNILDFRKKAKIFKIFFGLFLIMGLSFGFVSGFVYPLFLSRNGFNAETIGVLLGLQILLAGLVSHLFANRSDVGRLILFSGVLYTFALISIGFSSSTFSGILVVAYGFVEGLLAIGQEGIVSMITRKESYGTDIGLLWMGHHLGRSFSLAFSGLVISIWGFAAPFLISALVFTLFYVSSYVLLRTRR